MGYAVCLFGPAQSALVEIIISILKQFIEKENARNLPILRNYHQDVFN